MKKILHTSQPRWMTEGQTVETAMIDDVDEGKIYRESHVQILCTQSQGFREAAASGFCENNSKGELYQDDGDDGKKTSSKEVQIS